MADSMEDHNKKYNPEPSTAGQVKVTLKSMYYGFASQKAHEEAIRGHYVGSVYISERQRTPEEIKREEVARKFGV